MAVKLQLNDISDCKIGGGSVTSIRLGTELVWPDSPTPPTPTGYSSQYLTFESRSNDNEIRWWKQVVNQNGKTISASTDNGNTWTSYTSSGGSGNGTLIATLNSGDTIIFKGENAAYENQGSFRTTGDYDVYGNIMSLVSGDSFENATLTSGTTFSFLFLGGVGSVVNAENLILPATSLTEYCYHGLFNANTKLVTTPQLPATTLASHCYAAMFYACTSLTTAPVLPATTLARSCYAGMFRECTSLTTAPVLSATTLANDCYDGMFAQCTSLTTAPELPATTLADNCYAEMFYACTSLTTAPELPATSLTEYCYAGMFRECTSLTTAPVLSATTLVSYCYDNMFNGTSLNEIHCYAEQYSGGETDLGGPATECTYDWLNGVELIGYFYATNNIDTCWYKDDDVNDFGYYSHGIPNKWSLETGNECFDEPDDPGVED